MDSLYETKVERFKQRIGFDTLPPIDDPARGVVAVWPDIRRTPELGPEWTILADTTWWEREGSIRQRVLGRGDERVIVRIFVAQTGIEAARKFLLDTVSENMMVDVPYEKGPPSLGTLSLVLPMKPTTSVVWYFRNVCFQIRSMDSAVDILPIAASLQSLAETKVVPNVATFAPTPRTVVVSDRSATIGKPLTIQLTVDQIKDESVYLLDLEFDRNRVSVLSQNGLNIQVKGLQPGPTSIKANLVDKATLLSSKVEIDLAFF